MPNDLQRMHGVFNKLSSEYDLKWSYTYTPKGLIIHLHDERDRLIHNGTIQNTIGFFLGMKYAFGEL